MRQVFLNVPFDAEYEPIFRAVCFGLICWKCAPRCALESVEGAKTRLERIYTLIEECSDSIHDLSRITLGGNGLSRFNMPFELGLYLGAKRFGTPQHVSKSCLVLIGEAYQQQKTLSDLAGIDAWAHGHNPNKALAHVRRWLTPKAMGNVLPLARVQAEFAGFSSVYGSAPFVGFFEDEGGGDFLEFLGACRSHLQTIGLVGAENP